MGMNEVNKEEHIGDREGRAGWGEARSGACGDRETKNGHFKMEGRPHKRKTKNKQAVIITLARKTSGNRS